MLSYAFHTLSYIQLLELFKHSFILSIKCCVSISVVMKASLMLMLLHSHHLDRPSLCCCFGVLKKRENPFHPSAVLYNIAMFCYHFMRTGLGLVFLHTFFFLFYFPSIFYFFYIFISHSSSSVAQRITMN